MDSYTPGIVEVFAKCTGCGENQLRIVKVIKYARSINAHYAVHSVSGPNVQGPKKLHEKYLKKINLPLDGRAIVVYDGGKEIVELDQWKP